MNIVVLQGKLSRAPEWRELETGRVVSYDVTTRLEDGKAATAPVAWFGAPDAALELDDVLGVEHLRVRGKRGPGRVLDALVDRQDRHVAGATEAAVVEERLQRPEHLR